MRKARRISILRKLFGGPFRTRSVTIASRASPVGKRANPRRPTDRLLVAASRFHE
jgi:hypothetical protein